MSEPLRILVVDDYADSMTALCTLLRILGHEVQGLLRGAGAVAAVESFDPALVFLDIGLPDVSGYEIAQRLCECDRPKPYLVAITGWGAETDRARAFESGFDEHVHKPLDLAIVRGVLDRVYTVLATRTATGPTPSTG